MFVYQGHRVKVKVAGHKACLYILCGLTAIDRQSYVTVTVAVKNRRDLLAGNARHLAGSQEPCFITADILLCALTVESIVEFNFC